MAVQGGSVDVLYLVQGGKVISLGHDAFVVSVPAELAESVEFEPTADEVQAWVDEAHVSVVDVIDMLEGEFE